MPSHPHPPGGVDGWVLYSMMQLTGRGVCQAPIKWWMAVVYTSYSLRMEGEAVKESKVCGREQWVNGNLQSMSELRMAMANDSTRSRPCLMFYSPFHISSVLGYLQKWFPLVICKVILVHTTFALTCLLVEYFTSLTPKLAALWMYMCTGVCCMLLWLTTHCTF